MANLSEIYDWFMTSKKPTQAQFWASWGSFWNKDEQIPQSSISGLPNVLNAKAEKAQFDAHKADAAAHADLFLGKEDKSQKGLAGGYVPLNDFVKIASNYLNLVNDLFTGGATALLSAEQGVALQNQIDGITILLNSDNVDLDNVQELVDAIETVQLSLNSILVNDLTTGGTTKALTAEMGKNLNESKVEKVPNKSLVDDTELARLSGVSNIEFIDYPSLTADGVQDFEIPAGKTAKRVLINAQEIYKMTENNGDRTDTFSQLETTLTINQPTEIGNYIGIFIQ